MKTVKFDPSIFISPPYIKCPKCGGNSFGILMVCDHHYVRRCRECFFPRGTESTPLFPLPQLNKKVIYIDQFVISNMMKALNPKTKAYQKGTLDEFWITLFERVDSLCKLQLIICPDSGFHTDESLLSPYFKPLKRMYELLSHGVRFRDHETIKRFQICQHANNWISGEADKKLNLDAQAVVYRKINAWQDRLIISLNQSYRLNWVDDLRKEREKVHEGLSEVFKRWQSEKHKNFDNWFEEESQAFGRATLQIFLQYFKRFKEIYAGRLEMTANDIFPSSSVTLVHSIHDIFRRNGVPVPDLWPKTIEYLQSPSLNNVPFMKISSMLYAALARKAAAGQKRPPNQGMASDIQLISVLLPYCDAMFIDKECHGFLKEMPLSDAIDYGTKVFSLNNKEEFLEYLNCIEKKAPREVLDKVNEVYGEAWRQPYKTLYKNPTSDA